MYTSASTVVRHHCRKKNANMCIRRKTLRTHSEGWEAGLSAPPASAMADMHAYSWRTLTQHKSAWTAAWTRQARHVVRKTGAT